MNKYSILLVKNRYIGTVDINKYVVEWFATNANLTVELNVIETDFDVTTFKAQNATFQGVIVGADILPKLRTVIPEKKYNSVVFVYGNNLDGIRVSSTNIMGADPLYSDTEFIQTFQTTDGGRTINHEMFHAFFFKAKKLQFNVVDNMDTYLKDSDLSVNNVIDTNREIALQTLKPYWEQICAFRNIQTPNVVSIPPKIDTKLPIVTLTRKTLTSKETIGELRTLDGKFGADTLELPWLNNKQNVSCIPTGTYIVKKVFSLKFGFVYQIQNVLNRTGILFHEGNYFFNTLGCILLGSLPKDINKDGSVDIQNSKLIRKAFESYMQFKDFTLIIK